MYTSSLFQFIRQHRLFAVFFLSAFLLGCELQEGEEAQDTGGLTSPTLGTDNSSATTATTDSSTASDEDSTDNDGQESETEEATPNYFYFSYDDSASTASYDLAMFALDNGMLPDPSLGKPYEFLNAETFEHFEPEENLPFTISMGVLHTEVDADSSGVLQNYHFGAHVSGPSVTNEERDNVVLTLLIDISGSMSTNYSRFAIQDQNVRTLLDVVKHGLTQLSDMLKAGDVVNIVTFDTNASTVLSNWQHGDSISTLISTIDTLKTKGSTNLDAGIALAYDVAQQTYDQTKANRVVILTDAYANTGEVNVDIISQNTVINELEGIQFSGIGIGSDFDHAFLNELTDAGKGSYFSMVTPQDAERIFTTGLPSLINVAVEDVVFKLTFPQSLTRTLSAAEESSTEKSDIQTTNFSYNTSQFFIESFNAEQIISDEDEFTLAIEYSHPESGEATTIELTKSIGELSQKGQAQIAESLYVRGLALLIRGDISCEQIQQYQPLSLEFNTELIESYQSRINNVCDK